MKIFLDCLPCMLRQVLESASMATDDEAIHESIMEDAMDTLVNYKNFDCAPILCEAMHTIVKQHTGVGDPYAAIKAENIAASLRLEPLLRRFYQKDNNLLLNALKIAATGNIMDSALYRDLDIEACVTDELEIPFAICDKDAFDADRVKAKQILIIGDNAGEVVFDKILTAYLSRDHEVIYAVRDSAIINDATIEDALKTGITDYAQVISTGSGMPGAVLESCSAKFIDLFNKADIVISKGQGNFEALSDAPREIYFLLKAKCDRIAEAVGVDLNEYAFKKLTVQRFN